MIDLQNTESPAATALRFLLRFRAGPKTCPLCGKVLPGTEPLRFETMIAVAGSLGEVLSREKLNALLQRIDELEVEYGKRDEAGASAPASGDEKPACG